jgi:hypothetical protein
MPTVSAVHDDVHQRTGQQEKPRQDAEEMSAVFSEEKKRGQREKADEYPFRP